MGSVILFSTEVLSARCSWMRSLMLLLPLLLLSACEKSAERNEPQEMSLEVPSKFVVSQRKSEEMPGSDGKLLITLDDITRGQVMTQIAPLQGEALVERRSLRPGEMVEFNYQGDDYVLLLKELNNLLIGTDTAEFWLKAKGGSFEVRVEVEEEIGRLLDALEAMEGAVMIRNGKEYFTEKGAAHLRMKVDRAGDRIRSAEDFIEEVASKSSTSGKDYIIRLKDGTTVTTREWFKAQLVEMRKGY